MAVSFTRFSWWFWAGKGKRPIVNEPSSDSSSEFGDGLRETEFLSRVDLQKRQGRNEIRLEWDYDVVMVPDCGMQMPDSGDEADWSIGWFEPHGPGFQSDDSFAVLVPSYSHRCKEVVEGSNIELSTVLKNLPNGFSPESKNNMEQWLSSLQNSKS